MLKNIFSRRPVISRFAKVSGLLFALLAVWFTFAPPTKATSSGELVAWGAGFTNTSTNFEISPEFGQSIIPDGLNNVIAVAGGGFHSVALKSDGTVVAWGWNGYGQTDVPSGLSGVTAISAGLYHTVALKNDGTVVAWGANTGICFPNCGQSSVPTGLSGVIAISAGRVHTLALKSDGTVVAWGGSGYDLGQTHVPTGLNGVVAIAAGAYHSLAIKNDGSVVAWGWNDQGQLNVPSGLSGVIAVAGGYEHSVALKSDGAVVAWGGNGGILTNVPSGLSNVKAIAANWDNTQALKRDGTVVAWGGNAYGDSIVPAGLTGVTSIAAGYYHTLALTGPIGPPPVSPCGAPTFITAPDVPVGIHYGEFGVAVGDFDRDGNLDFATTNGSDASVSIRLGNGLGGFSGSELSVGVEPGGLAVGDFNRDGKLDLAITIRSANTVSIQIGDGSGRFSPGPDVVVGERPRGVAIGDFNNDGNADLITGNTNLTASVRLGDGFGGFSGSNNVHVGSFSESVAVGDFNNDGKLDFVTGNAGDGGSVSVRLGDGFGGFTVTPDIILNGDPRSIVVGDFNNDGNLDFAVPLYNQSAVGIRLGNGSGGFSTVPDVPVVGNPVGTALGDFNNDGKVDLLVASTNQNIVSLLLGNGAGGFSGATSISPGTYPFALISGDLNNDGRLDFVAASLYPAAFIGLGQCNSSSPPTAVAGGPYGDLEGASIVLNGASAVNNQNQAPLSILWTVSSGLCSFSAPNAVNTNVSCADNGNYLVTLTVSDGVNSPVSSSSPLMISNSTPSLGTIHIENPLTSVNSNVDVSAAYTDAGSQDTHSAVWNWGDGSTSAGSITEVGGNGTASASHVYNVAGIYTIKLTVTDKDNAQSNESISEYVVVYDATAGFVTGSGSVNSPAGAYSAIPSATGIGKFGFTTKYRGNGTLESETEFELASVHFHFHSANAQWLVISGSRGEYQGTGSVEESSHHFGYTLTMNDGQFTGGGGSDKFRLRIWDMDNGHSVVYDSQPGASFNAAPIIPLTKGDIKIKR